MTSMPRKPVSKKPAIGPRNLNKRLPERGKILSPGNNFHLQKFLSGKDIVKESNPILPIEDPPATDPLLPNEDTPATVDKSKPCHKMQALPKDQGVSESVSRLADVCSGPAISSTPQCQLYQSDHLCLSPKRPAGDNQHIHTSTPYGSSAMQKSLLQSSFPADLELSKDCVKSEVRLERIEQSLQRIESKLDCVIATQSGVTVENCPSVKSYYRTGKDEVKKEVSSPVVHHGITLTDMYASKTSPQKYARKVLSQLFSKEELSHCIFKKVGPTTRQELSPNRCSVLEKCLEKKYPRDFLKSSGNAIRESLNQKCREATLLVSRKKRNSSQSSVRVQGGCSS